jgi:hypothetical protein
MIKGSIEEILPMVDQLPLSNGSYGKNSKIPLNGSNPAQG